MVNRLCNRDAILEYEEVSLFPGVFEETSWQSVISQETRKLIEEIESKMGALKTLEITDWDAIPVYFTLNEEFIDLFFDFLDWNLLLGNQPVIDDFVRNNVDGLSIEFINSWLHIQSMEDAVSFIRSNKDNVDWEFITKHIELPMPYIEEFADRIEWSFIVFNPNVTEELIEKFEDKVDWWEISRMGDWSESFMDRHIDRLNAERISGRRLSEGFIRAHQDRLDWDSICFHSALSEEFIKEFEDQVNWQIVFRRQKVSEDFLRQHIDRLKGSYDDWSFLVSKMEISRGFIDDYPQYFNWIYISCSLDFSFAFAMENLDKLYLHYVNGNNELQLTPEQRMILMEMEEMKKKF